MATIHYQELLQLLNTANDRINGQLTATEYAQLCNHLKFVFGRYSSTYTTEEWDYIKKQASVYPFPRTTNGRKMIRKINASQQGKDGVKWEKRKKGNNAYSCDITSIDYGIGDFDHTVDYEGDDIWDNY